LSAAIRSFICALKSRAIVGNRSRVIHSQIGPSEPRAIRPELACSGAPSISRSSTGAKKYREGLLARVWGDPSLPSSARSRAWISADPGMSTPQCSSRSSSLSRQLRDSGVKRWMKSHKRSACAIARNFRSLSRATDRWRHLRAHDFGD